MQKNLGINDLKIKYAQVPYDYRYKRFIEKLRIRQQKNRSNFGRHDVMMEARSPEYDSFIIEFKAQEETESGSEGSGTRSGSRKR